ncbi:DoxX family protein [Actinokineospora sp. HUAS TT18]|uniref:DoxX family protein n=1 Tax=Actinokineospora sp. HUAS TT18 TaxID=3447451 RepID=UPI003F528E32
MNSASKLALFLAAAGTTHFVQPRFYDKMIPSQLPGKPRTWTYGSGLAEIGVAAAVAHPRTRRAGGLLAALLFAAVLPGNIKMAVDYKDKPLPLRVGTLLRLPLQVPLITWALRVRSKG